MCVLAMRRASRQRLVRGSPCLSMSWASPALAAESSGIVCLKTWLKRSTIWITACWGEGEKLGRNMKHVPMYSRDSMSRFDWAGKSRLAICVTWTENFSANVSFL